MLKPEKTSYTHLEPIQEKKEKDKSKSPSQKTLKFPKINRKQSQRNFEALEDTLSQVIQVKPSPIRGQSQLQTYNKVSSPKSIKVEVEEIVPGRSQSVMG
jgi:hypothetical protein